MIFMPVGPLKNTQDLEINLDMITKSANLP